MSPPASDPRVAAVLEVARSIGSILDLDELLVRIMDTVTRMLSAERSTLYLVDAATGALWSRVAQGENRLEIHLPRGTGLAGWVAEHGQAVLLDDAYEDERFSRSWDEESGFRTRALLCVPFRNAAGAVVGVMQVLNKAGGFSEDDRALLETIGHQCAVAIENARLVGSLEERAGELARAEERLLRANEELQILVDLERAVALAPDEDSVIRQALERLCHLFRVEGAAAMVVEDDGGRVVSLVGGRLRTRRISREWARLLAERLSEPTALDGDDALTGAAHAISAPLSLGGRALGVLQLVAEADEGSLRVLSLVASRVARALEARRSQARRERVERLSLVGQMMSGIVHDLRTPMSAVAGYAELMAEEDDEAQREWYAARIRTALHQMQHMTTEILEYARGRAEITVSSVRLQDFVAEVADTLQPDLQRHGTALVVEGELQVSARFDVERIARVVGNLARNAGEAGATEVIWRIERDETRLQMTLTDDGPGIPEALAGRLFQPFATHGKSGGTGLGLAMAVKTVEAHGGRLTCDSTPGQGASFTILLPADPLEGTPLL